MTRSRPWLTDLRVTDIRGGIEKPQDLDEDTALAWDLCQAGLMCRMGWPVVERTKVETQPKPARKPSFLDPILDKLPQYGEDPRARFLGDICVTAALKNWDGPIYLGPSAILGHDGNLTVTSSRDGVDGVIFRSFGLWVPAQDKIDPSLIPFAPLERPE